MSAVPVRARAAGPDWELAVLRSRLAASEAARRSLARRLAAIEDSRPLSNGLRRLTPRELQIAELVAAGATNREIADALFLSAKTVEWNLSNVYRKLYLRSRTELAAKMTAAPAPHDLPRLSVAP